VKRVAVATVVVTAVLAGVYVWLSGTAELVAYEAVVVSVGIVALASLAISVPTETPSRSSNAGRRVPPQLHRIERIVRFAKSTAVDADRRLYPLLRNQTQELLLSRGGIDLDKDPEAARSVLGEVVWDRIRPDRPTSEDRTAPGDDLADIAAVVGAIEEAIGRLPA
jgi:hypothetical protein